MGVSALGKIILYQQNNRLLITSHHLKIGDRSNPYKSRVVHTITLTGVPYGLSATETDGFCQNGMSRGENSGATNHTHQRINHTILLQHQVPQGGDCDQLIRPLPEISG